MKTLLVILLFAFSISQTGNWEYQFEKEGVKVYTKTVEGSSFKSFKGEMVFNTSVDKIVTRIQDISSYPLWCYRTTSTDFIKQEGNKILYRYVSDTPPMIKNREAYFYNEVLPPSANGEVVIKLGTYPSNEPVPGGFVRIPFSDGFWKLTPVSPNKTMVVFQMQAEPGGIIPAWISNMASSDSPWITMSKLQNLILQSAK